MSRLTQRRAFTLIELIVVVIIIGVLAAIAAVAYNQFVKDSRETAAKANAKQVVTAVAAFSQQHDMKPAEVLDANADLMADGTLARDAVLETISGDISVGPIRVITSTVPATITVTVAQGAGLTTRAQVEAAKHSCVIDLTGELPVLKENTCK